MDALPVTKNTNAELNAWASRLLVHTSAQKTFASTIETYNNDFDEDAKLCACCTSLSAEELGVIRKCISSDSQVSLTQKQVVDDSGKLASVYSKASPASSGSPRGSDVIDDTNYRVTAHFKTLISEHVALAHLLYTHTFSQGPRHSSLLSNVLRTGFMSSTSLRSSAYWLPPLFFTQYFNWRLLGWICMSLHGLHFSL